MTLAITRFVSPTFFIHFATVAMFQPNRGLQVIDESSQLDGRVLLRGALVDGGWWLLDVL